jgi:hypothetical protein
VTLAPGGCGASAKNRRVCRSAGAVAGGGPGLGGGRYTLERGGEYSRDVAGARIAPRGSGGSCEAEYHLLSRAVSSLVRLPASDAAAAARAAVASANPWEPFVGTGDLFVPRPARIRRFVAAAFSATDFRGVDGRRSLGRSLVRRSLL